ncbi:MAG TPA: DnaA regulatory inactivator Hda [Dyella sp.]|nr:DnaA regulatory inactivator Hda [Dyella sp.]
MTTQLPLGLRWPRRQRFEHFHAGANAAALAAVQALATQAGAPWLYLSGAASSGKSHLLMAACQAAHEAGRTVQYLPLRNLHDRASVVRGVMGSQFIALDDLDALAGNRDAEHALFDLYNRARAEGTALIFTAQAVPTQLALTLPDLRSRLGACTQFALKPLDDDERREVLKRQAALRGIELDDSVLDWLFARYARDLGALFDLLDRLDQASLAAQRRVTVPFLRGLLRESS